MKLRTDIATEFLTDSLSSDDIDQLLEAGLEHSDFMVRHVCAMHLSTRAPSRVTELSVGIMFLNLTETFREKHRPMPIEIAHSEIFEGADLQQDTVIALSNLELNENPKCAVYIPVSVAAPARRPTILRVVTSNSLTCVSEN